MQITCCWNCCALWPPVRYPMSCVCLSVCLSGAGVLECSDSMGHTRGLVLHTSLFFCTQEMEILSGWCLTSVLWGSQEQCSMSRHMSSLESLEPGTDVPWAAGSAPGSCSPTGSAAVPMLLLVPCGCPHCHTVCLAAPVRFQPWLEGLGPPVLRSRSVTWLCPVAVSDPTRAQLQ